MLWGRWIATYFDYLYSHNLVSESEYQFLVRPNGDLTMVWLVRLNLWNRWLRTTAWANQPTFLGARRLTSATERKGMARAARQHAFPRCASTGRSSTTLPGRFPR